MDYSGLKLRHKQLIKIAKKLAAKAEEIVSGVPSDSPQFEQVSRQRFSKKKRSTKSIVLASQYAFPPTLYVNSFLTHHLADRFNANPGSFTFEKNVSRSLRRNYEAFACPLLFCIDTTTRFSREGRIWADKIIKRTSSKWELLNIELEGTNVGTIIYDSYLRYFSRPTVDFSDIRLTEIAAQVYQIFYTCSSFLDRHDLKALIPDHMVYSKGGIISSLAWHRDIPIFNYKPYNSFYITKIASRRLKPNSFKVPFESPFDRYHELFGTLSTAEQAAAQIKAKKALGEQLSGLRTDIIFGNRSAFAAPDGKKVLSGTSKPKILVMLHDFCDAPHCYGGLIFPDFYEWIHFLLSKAVDTEFEWYVKPHPNLEYHSDSVLGATNRDVVAELKSLYPDIFFLPSAISNRQILNEGISALFTVHGTAGHEFAYFGIPVVNAGHNPHEYYDFNFSPTSVAEYEEFITKADKLQKPDHRSDIEKFYYMYTFYLGDQFGAGFEIIPEEILNHPDREALVAKKSTLDKIVRNEPSSFAQKMETYIDFTIDKSFKQFS